MRPFRAIGRQGFDPVQQNDTPVAGNELQDAAQPVGRNAGSRGTISSAST